MPPFLWQTLGARSAEASCKLGCANRVNSRETATGGPQSLLRFVCCCSGEGTVLPLAYLGEAAVAFSPAEETQFLLYVASLPVNRQKQSQTDMGSWSRKQRRSSKETPGRLGSTQSPQQPKSPRTGSDVQT